MAKTIKNLFIIFLASVFGWIVIAAMILYLPKSIPYTFTRYVEADFLVFGAGYFGIYFIYSVLVFFYYPVPKEKEASNE